MSTATGHQKDISKNPDRRSDRRKVQVVYFDSIECLDVVRPLMIKVGESRDHFKRRKDHEKQKNGVRFHVEHICAVRGERADEQHILRYFESHKVDGEEETFFAHAEIIDYIRWLRDQFFVWVPDCPECLPVGELDAVDSSLWMPNVERRKSPPQISLFPGFGELNLPPREVTIDDFYTNSIIIEAARRSLGDIELDPASHPWANQTVKANRIFTKHDDGLSKQWTGRVWLNPPFSEWQEWVPKILSEWRSGRVSAMCVLCATRTLSARYFAGIHEACNAFCVLNGRIPFWGSRATSPDDGHAVFYFGTDVNRFTREFETIGHVYKK